MAAREEKPHACTAPPCFRIARTWFGLGTTVCVPDRPLDDCRVPGRRRLLGGLCGVAVATTDDWLYREQRLPAAHAQRLSTICREKAAQLLELADDLDRHVETREAINAKRRGFMKGQPPSQRLMHVRKIFRPTF